MRRLLIISLFLYVVQINAMECNDWAINDQTVPDGKFRIHAQLYQETIPVIDLLKETAKTIPVLEAYVNRYDCNGVQLPFVVEQSDLDFLGEIYVPGRQFLKAGGHFTGSERAEQSLENKIKELELSQLARQTILIGQLYKEPVPQGFDLAWSYQLNENGVTRGTVDPLIQYNEAIGDAIFVFQDQTTPLPQSTLEQFKNLQTSGASQNSQQLKSSSNWDKVSNFFARLRNLNLFDNTTFSIRNISKKHVLGIGAIAAACLWYWKKN